MLGVHFAVTAEQEKRLLDADAVGLLDIDEAWLRGRFDGFDDDYTGSADDDDFGYTWDGFVCLQGFYKRAAAAGRAVIFTAM